MRPTDEERFAFVEVGRLVLFVAGFTAVLTLAGCAATDIGNKPR
jgi:hypothetical protein